MGLAPRGGIAQLPQSRGPNPQGGMPNPQAQGIPTPMQGGQKKPLVEVLAMQKLEREKQAAMRDMQAKMFEILGFTDQEAEDQFGFLMGAFKYGAPPHGGIAFGFDRLAAMFGGTDSIRDYIAFPKNNSGRDLMIDSPSVISDEQLEELNLKVEIK